MSSKNLTDVLGFRGDFLEVFTLTAYIVQVPDGIPHQGQDFLLYITATGQQNLSFHPSILNAPATFILQNGYLYVINLKYKNGHWNLININGGFKDFVSSLDWNPALGSFASTVGPTPAFSRASGATMVDVNGNVVWGPENLLLQSNSFNTTDWTKVSVGVSIFQPDPFGGTEATILTPSAADSYMYQQTTVSGPVVFSIWLRSATGADVSMNIQAETQFPITVTPVWQRFTFPTTAFGNMIIYIGGGGPSFSTGENIVAYGAQLERSSTARPYIPTTSAPVYGPRITYDPLTHVCLGYIAEEQRTNLAFPSLPDAGGSLSLNALNSVAGGSDGPMGLPYRRFTPSGADSYMLYFVTQSSPITTSVWVRRTAGAQTTIKFGADASKTLSIPLNQWVKAVSSDASVVSFTGVGTASSWASDLVLDVAAFQVESGAFPTSYIPTTTAPAVRSADVCQIGGADFTGFYNQSEGTIFGEAIIPINANGYRYLVSNQQVTVDGLNELSIRSVPSQEWSVLQFSSDQASVVNLIEIPTKIAFASNDTGIAASFNGGAVKTAVGVGMPVAMSKMWIGLQGDISGFYLNGTIARIQYFPDRLPDYKLIELTKP